MQVEAGSVSLRLRRASCNSSCNAQQWYHSPTEITARSHLAFLQAGDVSECVTLIEDGGDINVGDRVVCCAIAPLLTAAAVCKDPAYLGSMVGAKRLCGVLARSRRGGQQLRETGLMCCQLPLSGTS